MNRRCAFGELFVKIAPVMTRMPTNVLNVYLLQRSNSHQKPIWALWTLTIVVWGQRGQPPTLKSALFYLRKVRICLYSVSCIQNTILFAFSESFHSSSTLSESHKKQAFDEVSGEFLHETYFDVLLTFFLLYLGGKFKFKDSIRERFTHESFETQHDHFSKRRRQHSQYDPQYDPQPCSSQQVFKCILNVSAYSFAYICVIFRVPIRALGQIPSLSSKWSLQR